VRCADRLNAAAEYTCNRITIEKMHAHNLTLEFDHGNVHKEPLVPFRPGVDIAHFQRNFPFDHRQEFLDEDLAKMAILAAVYRYFAQSITRRADSRRNNRCERAQASAPLQAQSSGHDADTDAGKRGHCSSEVACAR